MAVGSSKKPRILKGIVVSNKMQKTIVVRVNRLVKHSKYLKYMKNSKRFKAHDEKSEAKPGDTVMIRETKPISKEKRWILAGVVTRASRTVEEDEII